MQVAPSGWTAPEIEYGYALCLGLAFVVGWRIRTMERRRLDWARDPRMRSVGIWALVGAAIGAKLGLLLFVPLDDFGQALTNLFRIDFTGKTVVGGLAGGYVAVELAKRRLGLTESS